MKLHFSRRIRSESLVIFKSCKEFFITRFGKFCRSKFFDVRLIATRKLFGKLEREKLTQSTRWWCHNKIFLFALGGIGDHASRDVEFLIRRGEIFRVCIKRVDQDRFAINRIKKFGVKLDHATSNLMEEKSFHSLLEKSFKLMGEQKKFYWTRSTRSQKFFATYLLRSQWLVGSECALDEFLDRRCFTRAQILRIRSSLDNSKRKQKSFYTMESKSIKLSSVVTIGWSPRSLTRTLRISQRSEKISFHRFTMVQKTSTWINSSKSCRVCTRLKQWKVFAL